MRARGLGDGGSPVSLRTWWQGLTGSTEGRRETAPAKLPDREGYVYGIGPGGLTESNQGLGGATQTDRRSMLQSLYEAYLSCPWAWASINAIARTITAGGLVTDWDSDDGQGDEQEPDKPSRCCSWSG